MTPKKRPANKDDDGLREAAQARQRAELRLKETENRWPLINRLVSELRGLRSENHFRERLRHALGEK